MHIRHQWVAVSAELYTRTYTFIRGQKAGEEVELGDVTLVLDRCKCGKTRTRQVEGQWTLEQLTQEVL